MKEFIAYHFVRPIMWLLLVLTSGFIVVAVFFTKGTRSAKVAYQHIKNASDGKTNYPNL